ncbi:MAG: hypothetical protein ABIB97_00555 [Patescibacteria group bacterium]
MDQLPEIATKTPTALRVLKVVLVTTIISSIVAAGFFLLFKDQSEDYKNLVEQDNIQE